MLTDDFVRDALEAAIAHPTGHRLIACPPLAPLPAQERIFRDAVARAREAGLRLPRLHVFWRDRPRDSDITDGCAWHVACNVVNIYLDANLYPGELRRVSFHEIRHAVDYAQGLQCSRLELEERANAFAAKMLGWCA